MAKKTKRERLTPEEREAAETMMFHPDNMKLDLSKNEKLRTTALLMAIQYVEKTICNDAEMYRALKQDGKTLVAASVPYVIQSAINFEAFLLGQYTQARQGAQKDADDEKRVPASEEPAQPEVK